MARVKSNAPEKDLSEKTSGPLSWDRTDAMHAMRCDGAAGVEETNGPKGRRGAEQGTVRGRKGDETDPTKLPTAQAILSLRRGAVRAGCLTAYLGSKASPLQGPGRAWQVGWGSRLHHPIRSPAAAPARDRLIPLRSTADILDSSARTCSP